MADIEFKNDVEAVDNLVLQYKNLSKEVGKVIVGQQDIIKNVLISVFSKGHCLLVGVRSEERRVGKEC